MLTFGAKARTKRVEIMARFQECLKKNYGNNGYYRNNDLKKALKNCPYL